MSAQSSSSRVQVQGSLTSFDDNDSSDDEPVTDIVDIVTTANERISNIGNGDFVIKTDGDDIDDDEDLEVFSSNKTSSRGVDSGGLSLIEAMSKSVDSIMSQVC